jgi:dipeptidyl aminopeptidase/acylaminoacyl peptidase
MLIRDPDKGQTFLKQTSPITYVDNIKSDLVITQGADDPRVLKYESDQIVESLRRLGKNVDHIIFADEGHGFTKTRDMISHTSLLLSSCSKG